jgi:hypothetical protein
MTWYRVSFLGIILVATVRLAAAADVFYATSFDNDSVLKFDANTLGAYVPPGRGELNNTFTIAPSQVAFAQGDQLPPSSVQGAAGSVPFGASNPWTAATAYPTAIARYAFVQVGQDSYVISGVILGADVVSTVRRYNATTDVWTPLANIPIGSEAPVGAFLNGKIYVADGGNDSPILRIYDIAANTWSAGPARPGPTSSYGGAAGAFNGNVYVVGGGFPPTTTLSIYNIASNTWSAGPAAPSPFLLGGYAQVGQFLYLIGSFTSTTGVNTTVSMRLDMATNTWSTGPVWTPARADFALAAAGTRLIAIGGDSNGGSFFDASAQVDELDTSTWPGGTWVSSPDNLPSARQANPAGFVSTGRVGGEIWSTGGIAPGSVFLNEHLFRAGAPLPLSAVSRKTHGAGPFDVPLPLTGPAGIECRSGAVADAHQMIFTFADAVTFGGVSVTTGTGNATFSVSGAVVTVDLTGVTNAQTITVTLNNVSDGVNTGNVAVPMGVLSGDTNGNGSVNAGDVAQTKGQSGMAVGTGNFRTDVNASGSISAADVALVKSRSGIALPP